jgi:hypothetical protein
MAEPLSVLGMPWQSSGPLGRRGWAPEHLALARSQYMRMETYLLRASDPVAFSMAASVIGMMRATYRLQEELHPLMWARLSPGVIAELSKESDDLNTLLEIVLHHQCLDPSMPLRTNQSLFR